MCIRSTLLRRGPVENSLSVSSQLFSLPLLVRGELAPSNHILSTLRCLIVNYVASPEARFFELKTLPWADWGEPLLDVT